MIIKQNINTIPYFFLIIKTVKTVLKKKVGKAGKIHEKFTTKKNKLIKAFLKEISVTFRIKVS